MPDPKHTVENIRAFLGTGNTAGSAQVRALAADYADMCREANLRLRRCADFLRQGLRGEAIAYSRTRPPLLDVVATLKFDEMGDWERTCTAMGLTRPAPLAIDSANHLIEAARQQEPLEELLSKHRYLALARAEPSQRLEILRQLIAADPASPCWKADAGEIEAERLSVIRAEAATAIRKSDVTTIRKLLAELNAGPWTTTVPADLTEMLSRASSSLNDAAAFAMLQSLVPRVRAACASSSYDDGRQVFAEWGEIVKESKVTVPPQLRQEILPLVQWLDEQDDRREREKEFRGACATLAAAIKGGSPIEQLIKLHRTAAGFDFLMPENLSSAYQRTLEAGRRQQRAEKRKQLLLATALVGVIILALAVLGYVMFGR